jgi:Baseplate J-like protein
MADELIVKNKDEWRDIGTRNVYGANTDIDVGEDSATYIMFAAIGEIAAMQSQNARIVANKVPLEYLTEAETELQYGTTVPRQTNVGSTGYVVASAASGGFTVRVGDMLTDPDTRQKFRFSGAVDTLYLDGEAVPCESVDTGNATNIEAGKVLVWDNLRAGAYATATVYANPDGSGFTGGRSTETLDEWKNRIRDHNANPAGHGNEGDVLQLAEDVSGRTLSTGAVTTGHGIPVQKAFVYPALQGPGVFGLAFLVKQDDWFRSRKPTSTQVTAVYQYVNAALPKDSILPITVQDVALSIDASVALSPRAAQWADFSPWPAAATRGAGRKVIGTVTSALAFQIVTDDADYTGEVSPVAGQTIGLFDYLTGTFRRKQILTVSGSGPWAITVSTVAGASDTSYLPVAGKAVCPWCDVLTDIAAAIGRHVKQCGVGECVTLDPGDGMRQMRVPLVSDGEFPIALDQNVAFAIKTDVAAVSSASFLTALPATMPVYGLDLVGDYLITDLGVYKTP